MTDTYAYQGAQDAGSDGGDFNERDFHIQQALSDVRTATLVKIIKAPYDKGGNSITAGAPVPVGYVDVQPLVNQIDGRGNATPHGKIIRLSYYRYQGGRNAFINDPLVGDIGQMVVADRDTSSVRATNAQANPGSRRKFDMADGTYFGSTQGADPPTQWFAWLAQGFNLTDSFGNTIIGTANGVLINGALIKKADGDVITKKGTDLDTHVHTGVTPGGGNTGPPA